MTIAFIKIKKSEMDDATAQMLRQCDTQTVEVPGVTIIEVANGGNAPTAYVIENDVD